MLSMTFATLPPEINSGRMCTGPGSGSMTEAAAAWDKLAAQLYARLADYRSVTRDITGFAPYLAWLDATAAGAAHAAAQAATAAKAFESALAGIVPLAVVEANRAQWISLGSTNCLGQLAPVIADTEAEYDQMWARDAAAMNTYARDSSDASTVTPFSPPAGAPGPAPQVMSAGQQVMSAIPQALQTFSASPLTTVDAPLAAVTSPLSKLSSLTTPSDVALTHLSSMNKAAALQTATSLLSQLTKPSVTATTGRAASVGTSTGTSTGPLSVPRAWAQAAPVADVNGQARAVSRRPS
jgi:PPE family